MVEFLTSDSGSFIVSLIIFAAVFIGVAFGFQKRHATLVSIFQRLALQYNGTVEQRSRFDWPRLKIFSEDVEAELFVESRGRKSKQYYIVFCAVFPAQRLYKIRVYRELRVFGIGTVFGQDIKTENPEFDEAFVIQGSDEQLTRQFLSPEVQFKLLAIKGGSPCVEVRDRTLRIQIRWFFKDDQQFDQAADAGLAMVKRIQALG